MRAAAQEFFTSGRVVDLVLVVMAIEAIVLGLYHRKSGRGIGLLDLLANLASGFCLLLALRAALTGMSWPWIGAALAASFAGHLFDVSRRWR
ncbi:MAG: hypothetical protein ABI650_03980 [Dokdonella sp.]